MRGFIEDGFNLDGYVAEPEPDKNGDVFHDALEFKYRPATRLEVVQHDAEVEHALRNEKTDSKCARRAELLACEFLAAHIVDWGVVTSKGEVKINSDSCSRLHPQLFQSMYSIVRGTKLSDPKPNGETTVSDDDALKNS